MEWICRPRRCGKTTDLIEIAAKNQSYIVCRNCEDCTRIFHQARAMGLHIPFPITMQEFVDGAFHGRGIKSFAVDGVEDLLRIIGRGVPSVAATLTATESPLPGGTPQDHGTDQGDHR